MKVLLINPPYSLEERYGKNLKHFGGNTEPLGLAYVAASVRLDGHSVEIIDAPVQGYTSQMIAQKIVNENIPICGVTLLTPMFTHVKKLITEIRNSSKDIKIVVGGAHATALPEETLTDLNCDFVVIGEGEYTFRELLTAIDSKADFKKINGLCYIQDNVPFTTERRAFENDLDNFPAPARDLLPMDRYNLTATRVKGAGFCGTIIVARGCPFKCSYCSHPFGRTFRAHSIDRIISEIQDLIDKYHADEINLEADTLTVRRDFIIGLCNAMIEKGINRKTRWTCESRVDTLDEELVMKMKEAGCWQISIGIESGVERLLKLIDKGETKNDIKEKIGMIKKIGISVRGFFMLGLPTETHEESLETIKFARELDTDWAQFTVTIPYPGTPLFDKLKADGEIKSFNWEEYTTWSGWRGSDLPYISKGRTQEELHKLQKYAVKSFYMRPKMYWKSLKRLNSLATLLQYLKGFVILLKIKE